VKKRNREGRVLRYEHNHKVATPLDLAKLNLDYHLFLSHEWVHGQYQMRLVKDGLCRLSKDLQVFLDVDDLGEGRGTSDVDRSYAFLCFLTEGFFSSRNCFLELIRAVCMKKPILVMLEAEVGKHGGIGMAEALVGLQSALSAATGKWNIAHEMRKWHLISAEGAEVPSFEVMSALLENAPRFQMSHVSVFQTITLRSIAERLVKPVAQPGEGSMKRFNHLLNSAGEGSVRKRMQNSAGEGSTKRLAKSSASRDETSTGDRDSAGAEGGSSPRPSSPGLRRSKSSRAPTTKLYTDCERSRRAIPVAPPRVGRAFHVYCSNYNKGAAALMEELMLTRKLRRACMQPRPIPCSAQRPLSAVRGTVRTAGKLEPGQLKATSQRDQLEESEHMLLYLTKDTWTQAGASAEFAKEVLAAMDAGAHLLVAHEFTRRHPPSTASGHCSLIVPCALCVVQVCICCLRMSSHPPSTTPKTGKRRHGSHHLAHQ
jgi:hypothetical protein